MKWTASRAVKKVLIFVSKCSNLHTSCDSLFACITQTFACSSLKRRHCHVIGCTYFQELTKKVTCSMTSISICSSRVTTSEPIASESMILLLIRPMFPLSSHIHRDKAFVKLDYANARCHASIWLRHNSRSYIYMYMHTRSFIRCTRTSTVRKSQMGPQQSNPVESCGLVAILSVAASDTSINAFPVEAGLTGWYLSGREAGGCATWPGEGERAGVDARHSF